jgi:3-isopropylmalate dehydrogenase
MPTTHAPRKLAVIPGDGIGPEVIREGLAVLQEVNDRYGLNLSYEVFDFGAERWLREKVGIPEADKARIVNEFAAVYFGALGDPRIPDMAHGREILLGLRFGLDLYINLRPVRCLDDRLNPLKGKGAKEVDLVFFRENTEGPYVSMGGIFKKGTPDEVAINDSVHTRKGVERIIRAAFSYAREHQRRRVTLADKSNVLRFAHDLWQRVFFEVAKEYPELKADHRFVDALCLELLREPEAFDVIVTENMLGDILTDLGAALQGGLGMAPSGNIHPGKVSLFEPVHGSAPPLAGKDLANPMGAILTLGMLLGHLGHPDVESAIESAVQAVVARGEGTKDIGGSLGTRAAGAAVLNELRRGR